MHTQDTIAAIATPPGRGGIGIVRLSGPHARAIAEPLLRLRHPLAPAQARFATVLDPETRAPLDEAVVTFFAAPHSYTGEDVVEIAAHGSPVVLETILRAALAGGARLAEPGEFTQRAYLAGRLGLTEAEAVNDLIQASTLHAARLAAAQLGGSLARTVAPVKQQLVALIAELEAGVDFAEDDLETLAQADLLARLPTLLVQVEALAATYTYGRLVRGGFTLAIVGRPNAGKSSLFNRLLGRDRAIVTPYPGTTRDAIAESLALDGIPVRLVDTAGLREAPATPEGEAEAQGIARTREHMAEADLILHVLDATQPGPAEDQTGRAEDQTGRAEDQTGHAEDLATAASLAGRTSLTVLNKIDLHHSAENVSGIPVSALTGAGIDTLRQAIVTTLAGNTPHAESAIVTSLRQHQALLESAAALRAAQLAARQRLPHELLLLDLHTALEALDSLTGTTTPDDILNLIFSQFCIGK